MEIAAASHIRACSLLAAKQRQKWLPETRARNPKARAENKSHPDP
jgi:hypothetical protein